MAPITKIPSYKITEIKRNKHEEKDFELYRFTFFIQNIDHLLHPHRHDHFALFFVTKGNGTHLIDFKEYELKSRRAFLIAPGQVHAWKNTKGLQGFVLLFTRDFFTLTLQYQELRSYLLDNIIYHQPFLDLDDESFIHFEHIFKRMEMENVSQKKYGPKIIRSYINIILFEISRIYENSIPLSTNQDRTYLLVKDFVNLVNKDFRVKQTVSAYAKGFRLTPSYLNFICKRHKGKSAGDVIHDRIILEAKRMLAHSEDTVAQIAYDLNFEDNSYFGRFFKKHTGKTPLAFRKIVRNEITPNPGD